MSVKPPGHQDTKIPLDEKLPKDAAAPEEADFQAGFCLKFCSSIVCCCCDDEDEQEDQTTSCVSLADCVKSCLNGLDWCLSAFWHQVVAFFGNALSYLGAGDASSEGAQLTAELGALRAFHAKYSAMPTDITNAVWKLEFLNLPQRARSDLEKAWRRQASRAEGQSEGDSMQLLFDTPGNTIMLGIIQGWIQQAEARLAHESHGEEKDRDSEGKLV